ncbi:MAG: UV DNA damage repair endonuclease UvsE [Candidatus Micrarchaeota archaeon]|nr:UV DNA damage repair endonuclease UvsE [Candidatus Micrarchaeota archaeon]
MNIGYPCINTRIGCTANTTFRLASYSHEKMRQCVSNNISCLWRILQFNLASRLMFFRISSDIVPFASHPVCDYAWEKLHRKELRRIGKLILESGMRISMHPDQFVLLNSPDKGIVGRSVAELEYHAKVLDVMGLRRDAKIQIHVGGVYGNKWRAIDRFCDVYFSLPVSVCRRLVIENDDRLYSLKDCLEVHGRTGIPVLFDSFHHTCLNNGESVRTALKEAADTWGDGDGRLMVDYSEQEKGSRPGTHASHIDVRRFSKFIREARPLDFDIMLEIKDKEVSALKAKDVLARQGVLG